MKTFILSLIFICIQAALIAQCQNPAVRLERLKNKNVTKDTLRAWANHDLSFLQLMPHDTLADIGTYDGYYPCLYAIQIDSLYFCLNDIDSDGFAYFDSIQMLCSAISGKDLSHCFKLVIGDSSHTGLPSRLFNKVIVRDALHHFKDQRAMLADIKRIMKRDAFLFLYEPLRVRNSVNQNLCKGAMYKEDLLELMTKNGFSLKRDMSFGQAGTWFEFKAE